MKEAECFYCIRVCYYKIKELKFIVLLSIFAIIKHTYPVYSVSSEY